MRNFTKFLALVLAMLMVSACAVSAAYVDQKAVDASDYAEAIAVISDLGIMQGAGDDKFNPDGTLMRVEAAVIAAKLFAGLDGQKSEWAAETCSFVDVTAKWSFAYINYVSQKGVMDGTGDGKFNPDGTLTIAEAITLAVKAAGLKAEVVKLDELGKPAYWATNWIAVADEYKITDDIEVWNYDAVCTRAMMAQIAFNLLFTVEDPDGVGTEYIAPKDLASGFGYTTLEAYTINSVKDGKVTLVKGDVSRAINLTHFEEALDAAGIELSATELKNCKVDVVYSTVSNAIIEVVLLTDVKAFTSAEAKIAYANDGKTKLKIDEITYTISATPDAAAKDDNNVIGGIVEGTNNIAITLKPWNAAADVDVTTTKTAIPTYYKAFAYDDDKDEDFDRLVIYEYAIATKVEAQSAAKIDGVDGTLVDKFTVLGKDAWTNNNTTNANALNYGDFAIDKYRATPFLFNVVNNTDTGKYDISVLETAATASGILTAISTNGTTKSITVGEPYTFADAKAVAPAAALLEQNVEFYTLEGKYVGLTTAGATANISDKKVIIDNVTIDADGNAVVSGYEAYSLATAKYVLNGYATRVMVTAKATAQVKDTTKSTASKPVYTSWVTYNNGAIILEEGKVATIKVTSTGNYVASTAAMEFTGTEKNVNDTISVKGSYLYYGAGTNAVATKVVASPAILMENEFNTAKDDKDYGYITYKVMNGTLAETAVTGYSYKENNDKAYTFIYIDNTNYTADESIKGLAEGQYIAYVYGDSTADTYEGATYNAVNLLTGDKVEVLFTTGEDTADYYIVDKDNKIVAATDALTAGAATADDTSDDVYGNKWIGNYKAAITYSGMIGSLKAKVLTKTDASTSVDQTVSDETAFGIDKITIYDTGIIDEGGKVLKMSADDVSKLLNNGKTTMFNDATETDKNKHYYKADIYAVAGQIVIVLKGDVKEVAFSETTQYVLTTDLSTAKVKVVVGGTATAPSMTANKALYKQTWKNFGSTVATEETKYVWKDAEYTFTGAITVAGKVTSLEALYALPGTLYINETPETVAGTTVIDADVIVNYNGLYINVKEYVSTPAPATTTP